ncbi:MAG: 30S ribosomal protein S6 [Deltaproteobacteria bacterium]|nr:30S ribosomal protein S6 [Deltaproteobacteria bacterium]
MAYLQSQRDQPGTQREYETIFIVRPDADSDRLHEINQRIRQVIEAGSGQLMRVENWGKRKLAYEIKKSSRGIYLYWRYLSPPNLISEVERNLRLIDQVIRFMTVKVDENVDPNARPSDFSDERFAAAATTIPDEEDIALGRAPIEHRDYDDDDDDDDDDTGDASDDADDKEGV